MKGPKITISCNECEYFSNFDKTCRHSENIHQTLKILETPDWCPFDLFEFIKNKIEDIKNNKLIKCEEIIRTFLGKEIGIHLNEYDKEDITIYYGTQSISFSSLAKLENKLINEGYIFSIEITLDEENDIKAVLSGILA